MIPVPTSQIGVYLEKDLLPGRHGDLWESLAAFDDVWNLGSRPRDGGEGAARARHWEQVVSSRARAVETDQAQWSWKAERMVTGERMNSIAGL